MSSQRFIMNISLAQNGNADTKDSKPSINKEKVMSYEEKSVGSTSFFKCEACPYMALAEDDIKFHLFTVHPELAKTNGLADNINIPCPGCHSIFDAEETLRSHLRNHHKMGIRDVKKMVKSLIQIALKDSKLKKEDRKTDTPAVAIRQEMVDVKMPQLIEIIPDVLTVNNESLPKGVSFISVDELQKMSTPNFEKIDPKEIIQEASINIVYPNEIASPYVNGNEIPTSSACNVIQLSNTTPDLISSVQSRIASVLDTTNVVQPQIPQTSKEETLVHINSSLPKPGRPLGSRTCNYEDDIDEVNVEKRLGKLCMLNECHVRLKNEEKLNYHRKCHQNGKLHCPECSKVWLNIAALHSHLWKAHQIDMELPTCEICGFKTYKKHRLYSIHMKIHSNVKSYACSICSKVFKNSSQLTKHKTIHKEGKKLIPTCTICLKEFSNARRLKDHVETVHEKLKPFKCYCCEYTAARKTQLKLHIRSHTGDKPYSCDQCDHRTADHNAMRRHKKVHAKEVIYKCKYCPYTSIQANAYSSHMIYKHPNINSNDIHRCPYCPFKTINKDKYIVHLSNHPENGGIHLSNHADEKGIKFRIDMPKGTSKPSWTIPSDTSEEKNHIEDSNGDNKNKPSSPKTINTEPIEVYDCDSLSETIPQDYSKTYNSVNNVIEQSNFTSQVAVMDLNKVENNSDCLSGTSNNVLIQNHVYTNELSLQNLDYNTNKADLHGYLTNVPIEQNLMQTKNVKVINHSTIINNFNNSIMNNFPIRLPPSPQIPPGNNITLKSVDKISFPMTKVTGPIITPTQILPVPSSSNSPVNIFNEPEGAPRKKPKISVKSNLILKGPDQDNMFHSQQKLAFKRLEDNERFCLGSPVTFNNLIATQFMQQLQTEPQLSESPNDIMSYTPDTLMGDAVSTPEDSGMSNDSMFNFNQQMTVNSMTMLPPPQKIPTNDPSYIKLETTIKQNTQSPTLERMCNANILSNQPVSREYKASPPLEDIHKNIKNEVKSDMFYNMTLSNTSPINIEQYLSDNMIGEQYSGHLDLPNVILTEESDDQQNDVIEIDDNSDDNKLLPRYDMNHFPLEPLYLMLNDFHSLENDMQLNNVPLEQSTSDTPILNQKENMVSVDNTNKEFINFIQGKSDPMMNSKPTNKINVKNIELMKN